MFVPSCNGYWTQCTLVNLTSQGSLRSPRSLKSSKEWFPYDHNNRRWVATIAEIELTSISVIVVATVAEMLSILSQQSLDFFQRSPQMQGSCRSYARVVTRYMGSGIKGLNRGGIRDHSAGIWDHNQWDRDQQCFSWNQGSSRPHETRFLGFFRDF